jgi:hypothetical protein
LIPTRGTSQMAKTSEDRAGRRRMHGNDLAR